MAEKFSELAVKHLPETTKDLMMAPLMHDTVDEIAQEHIQDWRAGECEPIPGKTMPHLRIATRNYKDVYRRFVSLGRNIRENGLAAHAAKFDVADFYDELLESPICNQQQWNGESYPSIAEAREACEAVLRHRSLKRGRRVRPSCALRPRRMARWPIEVTRVWRSSRG